MYDHTVFPVDCWTPSLRPNLLSTQKRWVAAAAFFTRAPFSFRPCQYRSSVKWSKQTHVSRKGWKFGPASRLIACFPSITYLSETCEKGRVTPSSYIDQMYTEGHSNDLRLARKSLRIFETDPYRSLRRGRPSQHANAIFRSDFRPSTNHVTLLGLPLQPSSP